MYNLLLTILVILSAIIVIAISCSQPKISLATSLMPVPTICLNVLRHAVLKL